MAVYIPGYEIIDTIHESDDTLVYKASSHSGSGSVIIKMLKKGEPLSEEAGRFIREYEMVRRINLDGIVKVISLEKAGNTIAMIMEDIGGQSLDRLIPENGMKLDDFLPVATKLSEILCSLHLLEIMHKNVNPSNIILNPRTGDLRLTDFGIATSLSSENPEVRSPGLIEGNIAYASPEQTGRMNRVMDYRTDLYSLGATFHEMLTGAPPFSADDSLEMVHCHIAKQPVAVSDFKPEIPAAISEMILKLLSKRAEDRYQSASGLKADLQKCMDQIRLTGKISKFEIGSEDLSQRFQIPQKLLGREKETELLMEHFERAGKGPMGLTLIKGFAGVGKTSLVMEIQKRIVEKRGYFISGKFDQFMRDIPYSSMIQGIKDLIRQILTENEDRIEYWKKRLLKALTPNGRLVAELIPDIELITGPLPMLPDLHPSEYHNLFSVVFQKTVLAFASENHPCVFFLDDVQWADLPSIKMIELLMTGSEAGHMLIVCAFRNNELSSADPFMQSVENMEKFGVDIRSIHLGSLSRSKTGLFVAEALRCGEEASVQLSDLCYEKTRGNPFFLCQFLKMLHIEGLISYESHETGSAGVAGWKWDIEAIRKLDITDNVVDLMVSSIRKLPEKSQKVLELAACIGSSFDLKTLSVVNGKSPAETVDEMWDSLRDGLIQPINYIYKFLENTEAPRITYRFMHNRIHQAVYSLIKKENKQELHLIIGRIFLKNMMDGDFDEKLYDTVNHLNIGSSLISDHSELEKLAELNHTAGRKARLSASYEHALRYFRTGIQLLGKNAWLDNYKLSLSLHTDAAEAAYLCTEFEEMDILAEEVLINSKDVIHSIPIYEIRTQSLMARNRLIDAIDFLHEALDRLGVTFPKKVGKTSAFIEFLRTRIALSRKTEDDLLNLPWIKDEAASAAIRIGAGTASTLYLTGNNLPAFFLTLKILRVIMEKGRSIDSPPWFAYYALALSASGQHEKGLFYSRVAVNMAKKNNTPKTEARIRHAVCSYIKHWTDHLSKTLPELQDILRICVEKGDFEFAALSAWSYGFHSFFCGNELGPLEQQMKTYSDEMSRYRQNTALNYNQMLRQVILNLMGASPTPTIISGRIYDEVKMASIHDRTNDRFGSFFLALCRMILCYTFEHYEEALKEGDIAGRYLAFVPGTYIFSVYYFYKSLIRLACLPRDPGFHEKRKTLKKVGSALKKIKKWAEKSPSNHMHKMLIIQAECERIKGNNAEAGTLYERAVSLASDSGFLQDEALANELMAKFYSEKNLHEMATACMSRAHWCYTMWGAVAKARDLEKRHRRIIHEIVDVSESISPIDEGTEKLYAREDISKTLDMMSVMKASQAISGEIVLSRLLASLLRIVIESAGAERGFILLSRSGGLSVEASMQIGKETEEDFHPYPAESSEVFSLSIVNYCARTKKNIALTNATSDDVFSRDPYIIRNIIQSVMCMPVIQHGTLLGILYLENNQISGAFTPDRVDIIGILCSQAAISIHNAFLYENLKNEIEERTQAEEALKTSEERYRKILEDMEDAYCETDLKGRITLVNESIYRATGYSREEFKNLHFKQITLPEDITRIYEYFAEIYKTGCPGKPFQWKVLKKNGEIAIFETVASLIKDKNGNPLGFRGVGRDISERKRAEESLREAEEKYRTIFDNAVEGIFQITIDGKILAANNALAKIFGFESVSEGFVFLDNFTSNAYVNPSDRDALRNLLVSKGWVKDFEFDVYKKDGSIITISVNAKVARDRDGNITHVDGITEDITERKKHEDLKIAKEAAEAATRSKSEFLATMSHEIRTPLNAILGMAELLSETELTDEQAEYVHTFSSSGELLLSIINDILDLSKIEAGKIEIENIPFDLCDQCDKVMRVFSVKARDKGIDLKTTIDEGIVYERKGDPTRLRQILTNLIGNAIKFTREGSVSLDISRSEISTDMLIFRVADTGIGIPSDKTKVIFDSFSQADSSTTRKYGGTGLGLSITKKLVELMGGTIHVESEYGKGTVFSFSILLPECDASSIIKIQSKGGLPSVYQMMPDNLSCEKSNIESVIGNMKILCAEDIDANRKVISAYLKEFPFETIFAVNGGEAFSKFTENRYDVVLMDMEMPEVDGFEAIRKIREWEKEKELNPVPIVSLTAHVFSEHKEKCFKTGCTYFLSKPFKKKELLDILCGVFENTRSGLMGYKELSKQAQSHVFSSEKHEYATRRDSYQARINTIFQDLVPAFFDEISRELTNMKKALEEGNEATLERLAHGLKGAAANYQLSELSAIFLDIERAYRNKDKEAITELIQIAGEFTEKVKIEYSDDE